MELDPGTLGHQQAVSGARAFETPPAPLPQQGVAVRGDLGVQENTIHMLVANWPPVTADSPIPLVIEE
jgi:hypothetical protein